MICPDCGKTGVKRMKGHKRFCIAADRVRVAEDIDRLESAEKARSASAPSPYDEAEDILRRIDDVQDEDLKRVMLKRLQASVAEAPPTTNLVDADKSQVRPGTTIGEGLKRQKVRYTKKWLHNQCNIWKDATQEERAQLMRDNMAFWWETVTVPRAMSAGWNGLQYFLPANRAVTVPNPIATLIRDSFEHDQRIFEAKEGDEFGLALVDPSTIRPGWIHSSQLQEAR